MPKILIADDSTFMRRLLSDILTKNGYTDIIEAENGKQAIEKHESDKPDLVLLDVIMPETDGLTALGEIAAKGTNVVMISAVGQESMINQAKSTGAKGYIVKPFEEAQVIEEIKKFV